MNKVIDGLFVGDVEAAAKKELLVSNVSVISPERH